MTRAACIAVLWPIYYQCVDVHLHTSNTITPAIQRASVDLGVQCTQTNRCMRTWQCKTPPYRHALLETTCYSAGGTTFCSTRSTDRPIQQKKGLAFSILKCHGICATAIRGSLSTHRMNATQPCGNGGPHVRIAGRVHAYVQVHRASCIVHVDNACGFCIWVCRCMCVCLERFLFAGLAVQVKILPYTYTVHVSKLAYSERQTTTAPARQTRCALQSLHPCLAIAP